MSGGLPCGIYDALLDTSFHIETGQELTFGNFIRYHDYELERLLVRETWTGWKAKANLTSPPADPDILRLKKALIRIASISGPQEIARLKEIVRHLNNGNIAQAVHLAEDCALSVHYRIWADKGERLHIASLKDSFTCLSRNPIDFFAQTSQIRKSDTWMGFVLELPAGFCSW